MSHDMATEVIVLATKTKTFIISISIIICRICLPANYLFIQYPLCDILLMEDILTLYDFRTLLYAGAGFFHQQSRVKGQQHYVICCINSIMIHFID